MARVVVCGAMGRMVRAILGILKDRPNGLVLSGALETPGHPLLGQDAFEAAGKPIVIGSTGLTKEQTGEIRAAAETIACVLSPNMSVGVNLMFRVAADVARVLGDDYDVEIVETHHRFKKDSPSGTAV